MRRRTPRKRRGYSLVEVLVYCTLTATLFSLAVAVMNVAYRAHRATEHWSQGIQQRSRLARTLTTDVHAAETANVVAAKGDPSLPASGLRLGWPRGTTIEYDWQPPWVTRTEHENGQLVRQEAYWMLSSEAPRWEFDDHEGRVTLELATKPGPGAAPHYRVVARVGRDARLQKEHRP